MYNNVGVPLKIILLPEQIFSKRSLLKLFVGHIPVLSLPAANVEFKRNEMFFSLISELSNGLIQKKKRNKKKTKQKTNNLVVFPSQKLRKKLW